MTRLLQFAVRRIGQVDNRFGSWSVHKKTPVPFLLLTGNKTKIAINGRNRIPDALADDLLIEVENVKDLSCSRQLRDFADYASQNGLTYELFVRPDTKLTGPLLEAIRDGDIVLKYIPGGEA